MAKWTDYTTDTNPTDTDEVMTLDADKSPKANKRVTLSTLADYFLDKLASKVFAKLETQNKTVIGALNELNSKALIAKQTKIYLNQIEWTKSVSGKYYYVMDIKNVKSITIGSWDGKDAEPDCIFAFISSKGNAAIFSDKNSFGTTSSITINTLVEG